MHDLTVARARPMRNSGRLITNPDTRSLHSRTQNVKRKCARVHRIPSSCPISDEARRHLWCEGSLRRIAEETGLKKTLSTCSEIVSVGVVPGEDSVEMVTGPIQVSYPCCGKWPTQKRPKEASATRMTPMDHERNSESESHFEWLVSKIVQVTARLTTLGSTGLSAPR